MNEIVKYLNLASGEVLPFSVTCNNEYIDINYNIDDIVNIINSPVIIPHFRIYVLYDDETINYELPIDDIQNGGNYSENYQNGTRRSLSFSLANEDGKYTAGINKLWFGTRLKFEQGVEDDNKNIIWFHKGIFIINSISPSLSSTSKTVNISAQDKFSLFEDKGGTLEDTYEIPYGSDIQNIISDILLHSNGNDIPYDIKKPIFHSNFKDKKTQAIISKNAGDTYGSILLELASQISAEIFYNAMGNLVITPLEETTLDRDKPLVYDFHSSKGDIDNLNFSFNMNDVINRVIVIGNSNNGSVYRAVAENNDPKSPVCVQRIGYRTGNIINDSNITTNFLAQERADYELRRQLILKTSTTVNIAFNPIVAVNNIISITDEFFNLVKERFVIQSLSCPIDYSGTMSMTVSNIQNLSFLIK